MKSGTITLPLFGLEIEVDFTFFPGYRAPRDKYGAPEAPDEPPSLDIEAVRFGDVDMTEWLNEEAFEEIRESIRKKREE